MALGFKCGELNINDVENLINSSLTQLLDRFYPVGSVIITFQEMTDQQVIARYGGTTWERIEDRYLVAAGSNHTASATGGSSTVSLTTDNLPSHSHSYTNTIVGSTSLSTYQMPSHRHALNNTPNGSGSNLGSGVLYGDSNTIHGDKSYWNFKSPNAWSQYVGSGGSHTHSDLSQSKTTGSTGSGNPINIEPSYIAVYMWKRVA